MLWFRRVGLDFLSQGVNEHAEEFDLIAVVGPPNCLQQLAMRDGFVAVNHQESQQVELLGCEPDRLAQDTRSTRVEIDFEVFGSDHSGPLLPAPSDAAHACSN